MAACLPAAGGSLWVSSVPERMHAIPASKAHTVLGQEYANIVFDAHSGLDVNALAAVSGTLRGGGTLYLLTPLLTAWPAFPDSDYRRFLPYPYQPTQVAGRFLRRLVRELEAGWAECCQPGSSLAAAEGAVTQAQAVAAIVAANVPVILTADRGRGKSAALGMAADTLLQQGKRVLLTAPARSTVHSVFKHASQSPAFIAPDALLQTVPPADVLLVDEAAAIPVPMLLRMVRHYPRCAFATTLHGYEGSGRGFALRFQQALAAQVPQWLGLRLYEPIRWAVDDPLERWLNRALLLDAEPAALPVPVAVAAVIYRQLDRDQLVQDESLLRHLFGLLVTAHYQTRPSDLRQLLDAPNLTLHVLEQQGVVLAVAVLSHEGGFDAALAQAIHAGKRRPHGHLLPQTLAFHAGIAGAAQLMYARIMRLAVHPQARRQGLGTRLVEHVLAYAQATGADCLGVSYAMTPGLQAFWGRLGFMTARIGQREDKASGSRSVVQILPLSQAATRVLGQPPQQQQAEQDAVDAKGTEGEAFQKA